MPSKDKELIAKYYKTWYESHKKEQNTRVREGKIRRRVEARKYLCSLNLECKNCSENDMVVLDFHHRDPATKDKEVSVMIYAGYSMKRILNEIDKCDILCANCHRREHHRLKQMGS